MNKPVKQKTPRLHLGRPDACDFGDPGCRLSSLWRQGPEDVSGGLRTLHQCDLHLPTGMVGEGRIND
ncbi:hypothetical protein [Sorangium sp. So ce388]|uniref:hypothetical protein n=1 Tax=Sorangium sp. So ce388 TaxID=3133309 RepID=UPI003F5B9D4C